MRGSGTGTAIGHHGEIIQGVFEKNRRNLIRGLVSMPCKAFKSTATFIPNEDGKITISPAWKQKAGFAARKILQVHGLNQREAVGGELIIKSNIPVGFGLGSSTADVIAAMRAVAASFNIALKPMDIALIAVDVEKACDSTMFEDQAVLFAQRKGFIIEHLPYKLPAIDLISVNVAPDDPVDTVSFPPARYSISEIEHFRSLRAFLRLAISRADAAMLGRVATASAMINQRHLPQKHFAEIKAIADINRALGIQVAHSGTMIGVMFKHSEEADKPHIRSTMHDLTLAGFTPKLYPHQ